MDRWTDQEVADLIIAHRRQYGDVWKALRRHDYVKRTIMAAKRDSALSSRMVSVRIKNDAHLPLSRPSSHLMQQNATFPALEPRQALALESLMAGASVTKAAEAAGVDRSSLHRWLREDTSFQAAYNAARRDLRREVSSRLQAVAGAALEARSVLKIRWRSPPFSKC